jgi:hypothetical protein
MINVNIKNILRNIPNTIDVMQTIYEAITNSFDADATNITITFFEKSNLEVGLRTIDSFTIEDNGEGFTQDNIDSFSEYLTPKKLDLGCKGVGRFTWLKVFEKVFIESQVNDYFVKILFDMNFSPNNSISRTQKIGCIPFTKLTFSNLLNYQKRAINIDLDQIKGDIIDYFLLKLSMMKYEKKSILIVLVDGGNSDRREITLDDIKPTEKKTFQITGAEKCIFDFHVVYSFYDDMDSKIRARLCANKRDVNPIQGYESISLPRKMSGVFMVFSKYLDERVNESRTDFTLDKSTDYVSTVDPITYKQIITHSKEIIDAIILKRVPEIRDENQKIVNECIEEQPYLKKYLVLDESVIKRKHNLISTAEKKYRDEKNNTKNQFVQMLKANNLDEDKFVEIIGKLSDISNLELAQYFVYRQTIIDGLKRLDGNREALENLLHNLFMKKGTVSKTNDIGSSFSNNIWLLDDKFMSYEHIFSDIKIDKIMQQIAEKSRSFGRNEKRPDMTVFFSNNTLVLIEFKGIGAPTQEKLNAIPEINRNIGIVAKNFDKINSIFGFIVTGFDEEFMQYIEGQPAMKKMFTNSNDPMYYQYNENIVDQVGNKVPVHIYITSTNTIWMDADARNKTFIDIVKKG